MTENPTTSSHSQPINQPPYYHPYAQIEDDEIDLARLFFVLFRYTWLVVFIVVISLLGAIYYSKTLPNYYKAKAVIFSPSKSSSGGYMSALSSLGMGSLLGGDSAPVDIILKMINSRRMAKELIRQFDLTPYYQKQSPIPSKEAMSITDPVFKAQFALDRTVRIFQSNFTVEKDKTSFITITYEDRSPLLAAKIVNQCIANLDHINETLGITAQKPLVIVMDAAEVPTTKSKPNKKMIILLTGVSSLLASVFLVFLIDYIRAFLKK